MTGTLTVLAELVVGFAGTAFGWCVLRKNAAATNRGGVYSAVASLFGVTMIVVGVVIFVLPFWKIFPRAGLPKTLSFLMLVPLANLIMLYVLAFKKWPGDEN